MMKLMHQSVRLIALSASLGLFAFGCSPAAVPGATTAKVEAVHFAYEGDAGPDKWGGLSADYAKCGFGNAQTPIDLVGARPDASQADIAFDYQPANVTVTNNGHTMQVDYPAGNRIGFRGQVYELAQFHFHHLSEHTINGQRYPLELHLVHKNAFGNLAVVAVLIAEGASHPGFDGIWSKFPGEEKAKAAVDTPVNPMALLPANKGYYNYSGSLTTPPCTEGVNWLVMSAPIQMAKEQISTFAKYFPNDSRPLQSLNGRIVLQK